MAGHTGKEKRRRSPDKFPQTPPPEDGELGKRAPNSLIWTLRGIRRLWRLPKGQGPRGPADFAVEFSESFKKVVALYPAENSEATDIEQLLQRLDLGQGDISYYHLRAFSEHIGMPVALLMMYSHVAGHVRRGFSKEEVLNLIDSSTASLATLRDFVDDPSLSDVNEKFWLSKQHRDGWTQYNLNISGLEAMEAAFTASYVRPAGEKPDIIG